MAWATPEYTSSEVDEAGRILIRRRPPHQQEEWALGVISNWRSSHSFPLNTFQVGLRKKVREIAAEGIVAQRLKRLSSIEHKLKRFAWLTLSEMQDIAGCRAVVGSVEEVEELVRSYKISRIKHVLSKEDNYIENPKSSGYRSHHLIYRYHSDKKATYEGLQIELQFRTPLQHAWATAVETVGTFIQQALKSSLGEGDWLRFFALMGTAIAWREGSAPIPGTPSSEKELVRELKRLARRLNVASRLIAYGELLRPFEGSGLGKARYFLLVLDAGQQSVTIEGFGASEGQRAAARYLHEERRVAEQSGLDAVLVSVDSLADLRRAYPNYFLDTRLFLEAVNEVIG